jgi:hypothetical protein
MLWHNRVRADPRSRTLSFPYAFQTRSDQRRTFNHPQTTAANAMPDMGSHGGREHFVAMTLSGASSSFGRVSVNDLCPPNWAGPGGYREGQVLGGNAPLLAQGLSAVRWVAIEPRELPEPKAGSGPIAGREWRFISTPWPPEPARQRRAGQCR